MAGDFLLWYKILAWKALIGWAGALVAAGSAYVPSSALPPPETAPGTLSPSAPEPQPHPSYAEVRLGCPGAQRIALTLDLGPWADAQIATDILNALENEGVAATLFFSGKFVERHPDVVAIAAAAGHQLANHTYSHPNLTKLPQEAIIAELQKTQSLLEAAAGKGITPLYFRPPYGASNAKVLRAAQSAGFRSVLWTVEALDWQKGASVDKVVGRVMKRTGDGAIILMHITECTQQALPLILERLRDEGYRFVTLEAILQEPQNF